MDEFSEFAKFCGLFGLFVGVPFLIGAARVPGCVDTAEFSLLLFSVTVMIGLGLGHFIWALWSRPERSETTALEISTNDGVVE